MRTLLPFAAIALLTAAAPLRAADTQENWDKHCVKCHGADGKGETKLGKKSEVKDFTDAKYQESFDDAKAVKAVKEGIKEGEKTRMKPAEGLSDDEITALVGHVRKFKK